MADGELNFPLVTDTPQIGFSIQAANVIPTATDSTLSVSGMAADAKATGDAIADLTADISDLSEEIEDIAAATGSLSDIYPVGAIFFTTNEALPTKIASLGTWEEVRIPLTWSDIRTGTRSYAEIEEGDETESGTVHLWLRTA